MPATYYIKVYYTKQGQQQPEIRRFPIDISPENDAFKELQTKIASFQSDNQLNNFTLQYNDEENERITFSSNDELRAAIALNKDGSALKVFVTFNQSIPQQQQTQQDNATNKELHVGVTCDGCNGPVIGFRYKCFVCPNYDLCEKCSSAGIHSEHNMIKITKSGDFQHPRGPHHHPHGPHHHPHGPYHPHGRRHRHMPRPPFLPGPDFIEQIQAQIPQWLPNRENTAHIRTHMQQHLDSLKANTQTHMQNSKEYLESVGQYLQQALSPFGIDCDYRVDEHEPTTTTTTNTNEQQQQEEEQVSSTNDQQHEEEQVPSTNDQQHEEQVSSDEIVPPPEPSAVPKYPDLIQLDSTNHEQTASASAPPPPEASTKITNPLEKSIDDCVERMMAMGFMDTHGALRELIRSKQGDINAVLDAINPRHQQA
jgi:sequestosome 1